MKYLLTAVIIIFWCTQAYGQIDSITYQVETAGAVATEGYLPLWIVSNRYGMLEEDEADGYLRAGMTLPYQKDKKFSYAAGLDLLAKPDFSESRLQQGYLKLKYGILELKGGWIEETIGVYDPTLSTGSLHLSRNARPLPKLTIGIPEYADVPFTKGYVQFKGAYTHGWLGDDRYIKKPYLHEKYFYLQGGTANWKIRPYGGIVHAAFWGGTDPEDGELPSAFKDYIKVVFAAGGGSGSPGGERVNALGDHRGILDFGFKAALKEDVELLFYSHMPFEDGSGTEFFLVNRDILSGISIKTKDKNRLVSGVLYEFLYTKRQSGPGLTDANLPGDMNDNYGYPYRGRDNYYNNFIYNTGWVHQGYILGTPLFLTDRRADLYFDGYTEYSRDPFKFNVVNNRVVAHHLGIEGQAVSWLSYRFFATYTRNFGTYTGLNGGIQYWGSLDPNYNEDYLFDPPLDQWYLMLEAESNLNKHLDITATLALDTGEMSDNFGALIGIRWNGLLYNRNKNQK